MTRLIALPARANRSINPYNALLYDHLSGIGWSTEEATIRSALSGDTRLFHVHWPQEPASKPWPLAIRRSAVLLAILLIMRIKGGRSVWTMHNLQSHEQTRPRFERWLMARVVSLLDGVIALNAHTVEEALALWPVLGRKAITVIPHAMYESAYPAKPAQSASRRQFGLRDERPVVGIIGDLKPYKGLDRALETVLSLDAEALTLFIAGRFRIDTDRAYFTQRVQDAKAAGWSVVLRDGRLSDDELVAAITACDLVLFPYKTGSNSGLAVLTAELGVPMLLSDSPGFRELAQEISVPTSLVSQSDFGGLELLSVAMQAKALGHRQPSSRFVEPRRQTAVARATATFFERLMGTRTRAAADREPLPRS